MNEQNYRMDYDERKQYVYDKAYELLNGDDELFDSLCEELDSWDGFLGDERCYYMSDIDEFFNKPSELLDQMNDFDVSDEYFYFGVYGVSTCDDKHDHYSDVFSIDEVLDAVIDNYAHIYISDNDFKQLIEILDREDFGIDYDWEYDEDMTDEDAPEETDDEFMERIDDIY